MLATADIDIMKRQDTPRKINSQSKIYNADDSAETKNRRYFGKDN